MNLSIERNDKQKTASVSFTCELDLSATLRTEKIETWEVWVGLVKTTTFSTEAEAKDYATALHGEIRYVDGGERYCMADADIAADVHAKALAAFIECHAACDPKADPDTEYNEAVAKLTAERDAKKKLRS